jgi:hypothetical protein
MNEKEYDRLMQDLEAGERIAGNLAEILSYWGEEDVQRLARRLYKATAAGVHLSVRLHDGSWRHSRNLEGVGNGNVRSLRVGAIVEGSDAAVTGEEVDLLREDAVEAFAREVDRVDEQACELWDLERGDEATD